MRGLLLRRTRSLLSALGIVFGVAAVIAMMSIGEGARQEAVEQIRLLGTNNIRVRQVELTGERRDEAQRRFSRGLVHDEARAIQAQLPAASGVAPLRFVDADVRLGGRQAVAQVVGTVPEYQDVVGFYVGEGRFLTAIDVAETKNVCILGADVKQELFGHGESLGARIRLGDDWFTVVGVMESKAMRQGRVAAIKVRNLNRDVYVPVTTAIQRFSHARDPSGVEEIAIRVPRPEDLPPTARLLQSLLDRWHRGARDFEVVVPEELLSQAQRTQRIFNVVMGSIAGISLLVGGIGIMNIMLANVSERIREIGIRRAVGATRGDILAQFLVEAVLVCLAGATIGVLLGLGLATVVTRYAQWTTAFAPLSVPIAVGTSILVGVLFGLLPARRAALLDPVQALRAE